AEPPKIWMRQNRKLEISHSPINHRDGSSQGTVVILRDITEESHTHNLLLETQEALQKANLELSKMAHTDALTGLANRRMLLLRLEEEIARAQRKNLSLAVLFIDLDRFKKINDRYGYVAGDDVLKSV